MKSHKTVFILFVLFTFIMTFPLIFKIATHIPGFFSTFEPYGSLWNFWRIKYSFQNHLSLYKTFLIAYPFGMDIYKNGFVSYLWLFWNHILSIFTTPVITWNIQILHNLLLSAFFSYLLIFYLTKSRLVAVFGGIVFGFCPYQFMRVWQHLGLTYNQWLPLVLLGAILLRNRMSRKAEWFFFVSLLLLYSFDWSIMYFGSVVLFCFFVYVLFYHWKLKFFKDRTLLFKDIQFFKKSFIWIVLAMVILSPQLLIPIKGRIEKSNKTAPSAYNPYRRPFEDLFVQSAKPLSYLLPSVAHPIFGKFTERFIRSPFYGISYTEHTLYLGWVPLILSFIACRYWRKKRKSYRSQANLELNDDFYIGFFVFLVVVGWLFSQPPWWRIGSIKIFMPSFFMYKLLPMYRAYCRFGIVVMLAISVLASFGLKLFLEKFRSPRIRMGFTVLFCGLVLFEFWNWPPYKVIDVSKAPQVYYWLREKKGDFAIAEYPLDVEGPNEMYKFYQIFHHHPIINGTVPGTYANRVAQKIIKLSEPKTASILKWMGVKYVLVHREDYLSTEQVEWIEELKKISQNPGLKFIKSFPSQSCSQEKIMCSQKTGPIDVYEVIAHPIKPYVEN